MKSNIIYISEFVGANLNSRLAVRNMRDDIIKENIEYVIIDFSNVVFASRSLELPTYLRQKVKQHF